MRRVSYIKRHIEKIIFSDVFARQMRFIAGPRQCGKTTIARHKLQISKTESLYYNWDRKNIRDRYRHETDFLGKDILDMSRKLKLWICFDEVHKIPRWKNILKDFFDTYEDRINFIVTGSAKLDLFRKSGDSLAGRYFLFKLNPFMLSEILERDVASILPEKTAELY
ncbi:AAA family ATPase, partial [bacterium]